MAKRDLNEEALQKSNLDVECNDELQGVVTPTYIQAIKDHRKNVKNKENVDKEREEATEKALDSKKEIKRNEGSKAMHLEESLFEDAEEVEEVEDPRAEDDDLYTLVHNELFGDVNYHSKLGLGDNFYDADTQHVVDSKIIDRFRYNLEIPDSREFVCIKAIGDTEEERKESLKRAKALAKELKKLYSNMEYRTAGGHKYGFIVYNKVDADTDSYETRLQLDKLTDAELKKLKNKVKRLDWEFIDSEDMFEYAIKRAERHGGKYEKLTPTEVDYIVAHKDIFYPKNEGLKEEYGPHKGSYYLEEIAKDVDYGNTVGYIHTIDENDNEKDVEWKLYITLNGKDIEDLNISEDTIDYILHDCSLPINDGFDNYDAVELVLDNSTGISKEDLIEIGFSRDDIKAYRNGEEISTYYTFNIEFDDEDFDLEEGLTKAERHNRMMDRIFANKESRDNRMAKFLKDHGVSDEEIETLKSNTGLSKDALGYKLKELGLWDEFFKNESLKESTCKKELKENFSAGRDAIEDLIDRARLAIDDGDDLDEAVDRAIDDGLIYDEDIINIADYYGVIDTRDLIEKFYEELYGDIYSEVKDYKPTKNLPSQVTIAFEELDKIIDDWDDEQEVEWAIEEILSDEEDFAVNGFNYEIKRDADGDIKEVLVSNIDWDIDEGCKTEKGKKPLKEEEEDFEVDDDFCDYVEETSDKVITEDVTCEVKVETKDNDREEVVVDDETNKVDIEVDDDFVCDDDFC